VQLELKELEKYYESVTNNTGKKTEQETQDLSVCKHSPEETTLLPRSDIQLLHGKEEKEKMIYDEFQLSSVQEKTPTERGTQPERGAVGGHNETGRMASCEEFPIKVEDVASQKVFNFGGRDGSKRKLKYVGIFKLLLEPETLRPLFLTVSFFILYGFGGYPSIRPFLVEVIEDFHSPLKGTWSTVSPLCITTNQI
jgi:hypothetical protein